MQALTIQLQESSPTLNKMSEVKLKRDKRSLIVSVMLFPARRYCGCLCSLRLRANGRNIVGLQLPTLLDVTCCVRLHILLHVVGCCCVLLRKVWNRSNFSPRANGRNIVGSCCARLHEALGYCSFQSTWQPDLHALTKLCLHCWF